MIVRPSSRSFILAFLSVVAVAGVLCATVPWVGDEAFYMLNFATGNSLRSVWDIPGSIFAHFFVQNVRLFVHAILQLIVFLPFPKWLYGVLGGVIVATFILALDRAGGGNWRSPQRYLCLSLIVYWVLNIGWMPSLVMNYYLNGLLILIVTGMLFKGMAGVSKWTICGIGVLAFLAGNGHEGLSVPFATAMLFFAIKHGFRRLTPAQWAIGIGFALGTLITISTPVIYERAAREIPVNAPLNIKHLWIECVMVGVFVWRVIQAGGRRKKVLCRSLSDNAFWLIVMAVSIALNAYLGIYSKRQLFPAHMTSLIIILRLMPQFAFRHKWIWVAAAAVVTLPVVGVTIRNSIVSSKALEHIEAAFLASGSPLLFYDLPQTPGVFDASGLITPCGNSFDLYCVREKLTDFKEKGFMLVLPEAFRARYEAPQPLQTGVVEWEPKKFLLVRAAADSPVQFDVDYDVCLFGLKIFTRHKRVTLTRSDYGPYKGDFSAVRLDYPFVKNIRVSWRYLSRGE